MEDYAWRWTAFVKALEYAHGNRSGRGRLLGLRVVEMHEAHGLHYHALLNVRLSVHIVRRVGRRFGVGVVWVVRCHSADVGGYMAKYLAKGSAEFKSSGVRLRTWGAIGGFLVCRGSDVVIDSPMSRVLAEVSDGGQLDYHAASYVFGCARRWGTWDAWTPMQQAVCRSVVAGRIKRKTASRVGRVYVLRRSNGLDKQ